MGKVPSSLSVGSSRVQGKAGGPSAFVMVWMGSGGSLHTEASPPHSPAQAGGPRVPLRKTASSSWEMRVLASRGAWGPSGLQRVPWAAHSLLSAAADPPHPAAQLTGCHHCLGGGWHSPHPAPCASLAWRLRVAGFWAAWQPCGPPCGRQQAWAILFPVGLRGLLGPAQPTNKGCCL